MGLHKKLEENRQTFGWDEKEPLSKNFINISPNISNDSNCYIGFKTYSLLAVSSVYFNTD